jgi:chromosome segregation ATPase
MSTSTHLLTVLALVGIVSLGCDKKEDEAKTDDKKTKSIYDVKQASKTEMSEKELEEARRKAGFVPHEERMEEAKAEYDKMEKGYIKGRIPAYRDLLKAVKAKVDDVEKAAPKWVSAEAAFEKWNGKYKEDVKAIKKKENELTENGSRGGNLQVEITALFEQWDAINGALEPKISESPDFKTAVEAMRTKIGEIDKQLDEIEKDESIEPETPEGDDKKGDDKKGDDKKGDAKKGDAKADKKDAGDAKKDGKADAKEG